MSLLRAAAVVGIAFAMLGPAAAQDPADRKPAEGTCDGSCKCPSGAAGVHTMMARLCECGRGTEPCNHARLCDACAKKKNACAFCGKPKAAPLEAVVARLQKELTAALPGHRVGRELPNKQVAKLLGRLRFFLIFHPDAPCKTCEPNAESLVLLEFKDAEDKAGTARVLRSADDLEKLLRRQELKGGAEAALVAAQLVQSLWSFTGGGALRPAEIDGVKTEGGVASFEFRKGKAAAKLRVRLDKDGAFERFEFDRE